MDEIVKAALLKWPHVPACYDWLALDARGDWYMRDERTQHAGPFPAVKGSRITHEALRAFIHRNYEPDAATGAWYFQNGPQRVYVTLEAAPWTLRVSPAPHTTAEATAWLVETHTGRPVRVLETAVDERGRLFAGTDAGLGIVHPLDMLHAAQALEAAHWPAPIETTHASLLARGGITTHPRP